VASLEPGSRAEGFRRVVVSPDYGCVNLVEIHPDGTAVVKLVNE
jgi:hypothetical protein